MLLNIKSSFILKTIFANLDNKIKFNIVVHNKQLQRKLNLNLTDFRIVIGRYIEKKNYEIIEYNSYNNQIIFEGEYSNGKRNGKRKEYNEEGDIIFEGEYLNGKKWEGISREYDEDI